MLNKKEIEDLFKSYIKNRYISSSDLDDIIDNNKIVSEDDLDAIYSYLGQHNIEIKDDSDDKLNFDDEKNSSSSKIPSNIFSREVNRYPLLTKEEEIELSRRIKKGDKEALDTLVNSNLRLVFSQVNYFYKTYKANSNLNLPYDDLVSYGNEGLVVAAQKFDPDKFGTKFSTFAIYWINQKIRRGINEIIHPITIPSNLIELNSKIIRFRNEFISKNSREPSVKEIADGLNNEFPESKIEQTINTFSTYGKVDSLDKPSLVDDTNTMLDYIPDNSQNTSNDDISLLIQNGFKYLNDREKQMIMMRYGIGDYNSETLENIGKKFNISKERTRQIIAKAEDKMRIHLEENNDVKESKNKVDE